MYKTKYTNTDSFLMFMITDENNNAVDNVVITKRYSYDVTHFFASDEEYIEDYTEKLREICSRWEEKLDFDNAMQTRTEAEFILYRTVKDLEE